MLRSNLELWCYNLAVPSVAAVSYGPAVQSLRFTTVAPGGFGDLSATLRLRDAFAYRPELQLFSRVALMDGKQCLFLGEISDATATLDPTGSEQMQIAALGLGNSLRDDPQTLSYSNQTAQQIAIDQVTRRGAYNVIDNDTSGLFPDNPAPTYSPSYVQRTVEEILAAISTLAGDYAWGTWAHGRNTDVLGFPTAQLTAKARDKTTVHYSASFGARDVIGGTIAPSGDRTYNDVVITYKDPTTGPGTAQAKDGRLNANLSQATAPFRHRKKSYDYSGVSTVTATQAQALANQLLSQFQNVTNKVSLILNSVRDGAGSDRTLQLYNVQADRNIHIPDVAIRALTLPLGPVAGVNLFYIVQTQYMEDTTGAATLTLQCDNYADDESVQIARLQLQADTASRNNTTTGIVQATGAAEKGFAAGRIGNAVAGASYGFGVNFKTTMTTTPTSITLAASGSTNVTSAVAANITQYGFELVLTATATANMEWWGSYQTVGN